MIIVKLNDEVWCNKCQAPTYEKNLFNNNTGAEEYHN